jgi:Tfp pilus assembly protein PilF
MGVGLLLAATDETVQAFAPGRSVESFDMVANLAGLTLGWAAVQPCRTRLTWAVAALALCAGAYVTWHTHILLIDYSRGLRYSQQQDFVRAREHFRLALEAGLRTPGLFNELGWVEIESGVGDPVKAVEYARAALDKQPENPDVLDTYGWALHHAGRNGEAIAALRRAYELDPDIFCVHYHLGAAYLAAGRRDEAEHHFRRQVERRDTREAALALQALAGLDARR